MEIKVYMSVCVLHSGDNVPITCAMTKTYCLEFSLVFRTQRVPLSAFIYQLPFVEKLQKKKTKDNFYIIFARVFGLFSIQALSILEKY